MLLATDKFSRLLFWDVDPSEVDSEKHRKWIVQRVLEYGIWTDWVALVELYGRERICESAIVLRTLDEKAAAFISVLSRVPVEKFECFKNRQSHRTHWLS